MLVIDGNSVGYASQMGGPKITSSGDEVQAVLYFLHTIRRAAHNFHGHPIIVLWDGDAYWRYDLYRDYKGKRNNSEKSLEIKESYEAQKPKIKVGLSHLGILQCRCLNAEADDVAAKFAFLNNKAGRTTILMTGDKDWLQLVDTHTFWCEHRKASLELIGLHNFRDKTGYPSPAAFLEGKILQGDVSDNIPGVGGIGEKRARSIIYKYGSVRGLLLAVSENPSIVDSFPAYLSNLVKGFNGAESEVSKNYVRNGKLMDLNHGRHFVRNISKNPGRFCRQSWNVFCEQNGFTSLIDNTEWLKPFIERANAYE